jgi:FKBP-type peptidyl-prolyl cis-trans isomerase (trigger factor)
VFSANGAVFTLAWGIAPGVTDKDFLALKARFIHVPLTEESIDSRLQRLQVGREIPRRGELKYGKRPLALTVLYK